MRILFIYLIKLYQKYLRRFHNRKCIYEPSCSNYAILVFQQHGVNKGLCLTYYRIKRCNGALYQGGVDYP